MKNNTVSISETNIPVVLTTVSGIKGYRIERRYEGDRTAAQVVSALIKVHDHGEVT